MERAHQINSCFCFLAGVGLNCLLMWLIVKKAHGDWKVCTRILLQVAVIGLLYSVLNFISMPVGAIIGLLYRVGA